MSNNESNMLWKNSRNNVNKIGRISVKNLSAKIFPQTHLDYQQPNSGTVVKKPLNSNIFEVIHIYTPLILVTNLYI